MNAIDPMGDDSEQKLVAVLERFGIVPTSELKQALMEWKVRGWEVWAKYRTMP